MGNALRTDIGSFRDPEARLVWPVCAYNPYGAGRTGPEPAHAVGAISVPLHLTAVPGRSVRPRGREIAFAIELTFHRQPQMYNPERKKEFLGRQTCFMDGNI
jgi:hypothetical protein